MRAVNLILIILVVIYGSNAQTGGILSPILGTLSKVFDPFGLFNFEIPQMQQPPQRTTVRQSAPELAKIGRSIDGSGNNKNNLTLVDPVQPCQG